MSNPSAGGGGGLLSSPEATGKLRARINALHIEEDDLKGKLTAEQIVAVHRDPAYRAKVMELYKQREDMDHKLQTERARKLHYNDEDEKMHKIWSKQDKELEKHYKVGLQRNREELSLFRETLSKTPAKEREKRRAIERNIDMILQTIESLNEIYEADKQTFSRERQELMRKQERKSLSQMNKEIQELTQQLENFDIAKEAGNPPRYMGLGTGPKPERRERVVEEPEPEPESPKPKGAKALKATESLERHKEYHKTHKPYSPLSKEQIAEGNAKEKEKQEAKKEEERLESLKKQAKGEYIGAMKREKMYPRSAIMKEKMNKWLDDLKGKKTVSKSSNGGGTE